MNFSLQVEFHIMDTTTSYLQVEFQFASRFMDTTTSYQLIINRQLWHMTQQLTEHKTIYNCTIREHRYV